MPPSRRDKDGKRAAGPNDHIPSSNNNNDHTPSNNNRGPTSAQNGNSSQSAPLHPTLVARQRRGQPYPTPSASPSPDAIRLPPRLFPNLSGLGGRSDRERVRSASGSRRHAEHAGQTGESPFSHALSAVLPFSVSLFLIPNPMRMVELNAQRQALSAKTRELGIGEREVTTLSDLFGQFLPKVIPRA